MSIQRHHNLLWVLVVFLSASFSGGCATTGGAEGDTLERPNRVSFNFNEGLDKYFMKPVAKSYRRVTPNPLRAGVTRFFSNLYYPNTILNDFLQGKFEQGSQDVARFVINSTLGLGGLLDPASTGGLKQHNEDLGQTLATWGVGQGPYLVLPLQGPNTVRNAGNLGTSAILNPLFYVATVAALPVGVLDLISRRANLLEKSEIRDAAALDTYAFTREVYLQRRTNLIYDGDPPPTHYELSALIDE